MTGTRRAAPDSFAADAARREVSCICSAGAAGSNPDRGHGGTSRRRCRRETRDLVPSSLRGGMRGASQRLVRYPLARTANKERGTTRRPRAAVTAPDSSTLPCFEGGSCKPPPQHMQPSNIRHRPCGPGGSFREPPSRILPEDAWRRRPSFPCQLRQLPRTLPRRTARRTIRQDSARGISSQLPGIRAANAPTLRKSGRRAKGGVFGGARRPSRLGRIRRTPRVSERSKRRRTVRFRTAPISFIVILAGRNRSASSKPRELRLRLTAQGGGAKIAKALP